MKTSYFACSFQWHIFSFQNIYNNNASKEYHQIAKEIKQIQVCAFAFLTDI